MKVAEFEEIVGLSINKLYFLLLKCSWELLDAYAVTGREPYSRGAEALAEIYHHIGRTLVCQKTGKTIIS